MKYLKLLLTVFCLAGFGSLGFASVCEEECCKEAKVEEPKSVKEAPKEETKKIKEESSKKEESENEVVKIDFEEFEKFAQMLRDTEIDQEVKTKTTEVSTNGNLA